MCWGSGVAPADILCVYCAIIRSVLEYASVVFANLPQTLSDDLERVQKRALAIIHPNCSYDDWYSKTSRYFVRDLWTQSYLETHSIELFIAGQNQWTMVIILDLTMLRGIIRGGPSLTRHSGKGGSFMLVKAFPSNLLHVIYLRTICFTASLPRGIEYFSLIEFKVSLTPSWWTPSCLSRITRLVKWCL